MTQPRGILFLKRHFMRVMIASRYAGLVRIVAFIYEDVEEKKRFLIPKCKGILIIFFSCKHFFFSMVNLLSEIVFSYIKNILFWS